VGVTSEQVEKLLSIYINWGNKNVTPIFYKLLLKRGYNPILFIKPNKKQK